MGIFAMKMQEGDNINFFQLIYVSQSQFAFIVH